ncbi:PepSY domain-containing protein [Priestia aryabhattai]|uniref:PepSY domain-containing protein n=1 Tax=Priestia aryabhattai TaxID=412384 RepID=UPI0036903A29
MNKFGKVLSGVALGTMVGLSSLTSAFAAEVPNTNSAKVETQHQTKSHNKIEQQKKSKVKSQQYAKLLTRQQAINIALKHHKGKAKSVQLKNNVYVITIFDGHDHHVKVDAKSGKFLDIR